MKTVGHSVPYKVEDAKKKFLALRPCCLDPFWSKPLQEKVAADKMEFGNAIKQFFASLRPVSLREEQAHTIQRLAAGGEKARAVTSVRQRASSVAFAVKRHYTARGGRNLDFAKNEVRTKYKTIQKGKREIFERPNQMGSTMIFYVNSQFKLKGGTRQDHKTAWQALSAEQKELWKSRHQNSVRLRRAQKKSEEKFFAAQTQQQEALQTSWGIGEQEWPLKPALLAAFLKRLQTKQAGLQTLRGIAPQSPEAESYVQSVQDGSVAFHYKDALALYCNNFFGDGLTSEDVQACALTEEIISTELPHIGCHAMHPGMCRTKDASLKGGVDAFFKALPKKSCVLELKTSHFIVYARSVLGGENEKTCDF